MPGPDGQFDLIVLGAGPAGASAAMVAVQAGLRVALVDKRRFPRDKLCGGGLTGRAMRHYGAIFGKQQPDVPIVRRDSFQFHAFGQDLIGENAVGPNDKDKALGQLGRIAIGRGLRPELR